jgi:hypothetical protein
MKNSINMVALHKNLAHTEYTIKNVVSYHYTRDIANFWASTKIEAQL